MPARPWRGIFIGTLVLMALLLAAWEWHWRDAGAPGGYKNSNGLWSIQRRRIDHGEGGATVLIGDSRVLFDLQLPVWERLSGHRPIQLAIEGTSPMFALEDLADDPAFTGRLLIGVAPDIFFKGAQRRTGLLTYYRKETPAQRAGQWLSMHLLEPYLAFDDPDFALFTVLKRQPWPLRPGRPFLADVRKLSVIDADRNCHLWSKVENDPDYREQARQIWTQRFAPPPHGAPSRDRTQAIAQEQIERAAAAVIKLRARGVDVIFVRMPSSGAYLAYENKIFPREHAWDVLITRSGAPGIYFEDYPELSGYTLPEWSHLSAADAERFTASLYSIIERDYWLTDKQP
ncbi:hypothetical protein [Dyella koreensis]|uniref:hypothetical protein n=1 Tax=Dyella koreensis TaxID=311235 RepID=UPI003621C33B